MYEIRTYHFRPDLFEPYKVGVKGEAIPYLDTQMDVPGFWVTTTDAPEILGAPHDGLGTANVTWIIRWRDLGQRNEVWTRVFASPEWIDIFSRVQEGLPGYLRIEAKFTEALT